MLGFVGDTSIDTSVADVTVRVVLPETVPDIALMTVEPAATAVARPLEPGALLTVATAAADEVQVTDAVRSWLVLSEKMPVAVNCLVVPGAMLGLVGVTAIETRIAPELFVTIPPPLLLQLVNSIPIITIKPNTVRVCFILFCMSCLLSA